MSMIGIRCDRKLMNDSKTALHRFRIFVLNAMFIKTILAILAILIY